MKVMAYLRGLCAVGSNEQSELQNGLSLTLGARRRSADCLRLPTAILGSVEGSLASC